MVLFSELDKFIKDNMSELNPDSFIIIKDGNYFSIVRDGMGYLNIMGDWVHRVKGEVVFDNLSDKGVSALWSSTLEGMFGKVSDTPDDDNYRILSNMSYDIPFMTIDIFNKKWSDNINGDSILTTVAFDKPKDRNGYAMVSGIELVKTPTFLYKDSWGHATEKHYKYNCVAIVLGDNIDRTFEVQKFEKFINNYKKSDRI